jgi:DNA-directed RNA polymerase subunit E'/Rpb7
VPVLFLFSSVVKASHSQDTVALQPHTFGLDPVVVLARELNKKYANRILQDIGLGVSVFDLTKIGEGKVRYGDGCLWYKGSTIFASSRRSY